MKLHEKIKQLQKDSGLNIYTLVANKTGASRATVTGVAYGHYVPTTGLSLVVLRELERIAEMKDTEEILASFSVLNDRPIQAKHYDGSELVSREFLIESGIYTCGTYRKNKSESKFTEVKHDGQPYVVIQSLPMETWKRTTNLLKSQTAEREQEGVPMEIAVSEELTVTVIPSTQHEYTIPTLEVAKGYGITEATIRHHQTNHADELIENKHFIKGVQNLHTLEKNAQPHQIFWTKRGVIRLGFFIRSERAKQFRDWAEDLVIHVAESGGRVINSYTLPESGYRKQRINDKQLLSIMRDVCMIDDNRLRKSITNKLLM